MTAGPRSSSEGRPSGPKKIRVYSRRGDLGETSLFSGPRVGKDHPRIEAVGSIDELSSFIGLARAFSLPAPIDGVLEKVQRKLIEVGTEITAMTPDRHDVKTVQPGDIQDLEDLIDSFSAPLPPLAGFLLPGGTPPQAFLQTARAVCRRAERRVVALVRGDASVSRRLIIWLNRLGDLLFVLARSV